MIVMSYSHNSSRLVAKALTSFSLTQRGKISSLSFVNTRRRMDMNHDIRNNHKLTTSSATRMPFITNNNYQQHINPSHHHHRRGTVRLASSSSTSRIDTDHSMKQEPKEQHLSSSRTFQLLSFGQTADDVKEKNGDASIITISCDGRIEGTTLELTHWNGNETPDIYYDDTSTGMALKFVSDQNSNNDDVKKYQNAIVLNNHYDTDGVLSVYTCLYPKIALEYKELLLSGAEAGDFNEWNDNDHGIKLDASILQILADHDNNEKIAYEKAIELLPNLLHDIHHNHGMKHIALWEGSYDHIMKSYQCFLNESANITLHHDIAIIEEPYYLSSHAIHRIIYESDYHPTRLLRIIHHDDGFFDCYYEKPGYGWVKKLTHRRSIPDATGISLVMESLSSSSSGMWQMGGQTDFVSICYGTNINRRETSPYDIANEFIEHDQGATW